MKNYFIFELKRFLNNRKTLAMVIVLFAFLSVIFYGIYNEGLGDQRKTLDEELNQTRIISQYTQRYNEDNEEEYALSQNLAKQQQTLATQANGIRFEESEWYLRSGIELATLRLEMLGNDYFSDLPTTLLPSEDLMRRDLVELEAIEKEGITLVENAESAPGFLREVLFIFGLLAFGYLLIFGSDISMDEFDHGTMIESYPITPLQKIWSKLIIYSTGVTAASGFVFLLGMLIASFTWGVGNFHYPVGMYLLGSFEALPLWTFALLFFIYYFVLAIHTFLLAMTLNRYLRNSIATIIVGLVLFILPYLYPTLTNFLNFLPFHYYNVIALFNGQFAMEIADFMDVAAGIVVLILYSVLLFFIIIRKEKRQTTVK